MKKKIKKETVKVKKPEDLKIIEASDRDSEEYKLVYGIIDETQVKIRNLSEELIKSGVNPKHAFLAMMGVSCEIAYVYADTCQDASEHCISALHTYIKTLNEQRQKIESEGKE